MRSDIVSLRNGMNAIYNSGFGFRFVKPKIFLIGFNKCGTTSLHKFFRDQGLHSAHCWIGQKFLALEAAASQDIDKCHKVFSGAQVFSDFTFLKENQFVEPLDKFPIWRKAFPNSYFILNDRPIDDWVNSRLLHKGGSFLQRYLSFSGLDEHGVILQWREKFLAHRENVLSFFQDDEKFCHFMVGLDSITKIVQFLQPDYRLDPKIFKTRNSRNPNT